MAIVQRFHGDADGVVNVNIGDHSFASNAVIISTGIGKQPTAYKILGDSFVSPDQMGIGGAVETIIRTATVAGTIIAYQVDAGQLSVLMESTGWAVDANLQSAITSIGNRLVDATVPVTAYNFANVVVSSSGGIKLA